MGNRLRLQEPIHPKDFQKYINEYVEDFFENYFESISPEKLYNIKEKDDDFWDDFSHEICEAIEEKTMYCPKNIYNRKIINVEDYLAERFLKGYEQVIMGMVTLCIDNYRWNKFEKVQTNIMSNYIF